MNAKRSDTRWKNAKDAIAVVCQTDERSYGENLPVAGERK